MELLGISGFSIMTAVHFRLISIQSIKKIKLTSKYIIIVFILHIFYAFPTLIICIISANEANNYQIEIQKDIMQVNFFLI